jgi:hypothetical protein
LEEYLIVVFWKFDSSILKEFNSSILEEYSIDNSILKEYLIDSNILEEIFDSKISLVFDFLITPFTKPIHYQKIFPYIFIWKFFFT